MYNKLRQKLGKYSISRLTVYIILTYLIGYLISYISPNIIEYLKLYPDKVLNGEIWRIFTWVLTPPGTLSILTIITLYFYYVIGVSLENVMGDFAYNLYIFGGLLITVVVTLLAYIIGNLLGISIVFAPTTYYLSLSIFLAYAVNYPNTSVYLFFIIPVKVKWMAYAYIAFLVVECIMGGAAVRVMVIASLANFIIYFFNCRQLKYISPSELKRKKEFKNNVKMPQGITRHKCAICGKTERDGNLTFRFCSKCNGNYEYCEEHLYTHQHVK